VGGAPHNVVTELGAAFDGRGQDLRSLAVALSGLSESGAELLYRAVDLVHDSRTVLATRSEQCSAIEDFGADLDVLADRLRSSDPSAVQPWDSKPKAGPNKLDLNPIANRLVRLLGATPR
jgi:phospholipid/cholesterol/gamma-HCH transport system substrate-binding protein